MYLKKRFISVYSKRLKRKQTSEFLVKLKVASFVVYHGAKKWVVRKRPGNGLHHGTDQDFLDREDRDTDTMNK